MRLDEDFFDNSDKVSESELNELEKPFFAEEVKRAITESYSDGVPGPDGFSFMFYQTF